MNIHKHVRAEKIRKKSSSKNPLKHKIYNFFFFSTQTCSIGEIRKNIPLITESKETLNLWPIVEETEYFHLVMIV